MCRFGPRFGSKSYQRIPIDSACQNGVSTPGNTTSCGFVPAGLSLVVAGRIRPRTLLDFGLREVLLCFGLYWA